MMFNPKIIEKRTKKVKYYKSGDTGYILIKSKRLLGHCEKDVVVTIEEMR